MFWLVIPLLVVTEILYRNREHVWYSIAAKKRVALPTQSYILRGVSDLISAIPASESSLTFVDIGCGSGSVLKYIQRKHSFGQIFGVEKDSSIPFEKDVRILHADATEVDFPDNLVVYMYDPLWQLPAPEARDVYRRIFKRLRGKQIYLIYCSALLREIITKDFLEEEGFGHICARRVPFSVFIPFLSYRLLSAKRVV